MQEVHNFQIKVTPLSIDKFASARQNLWAK